MFKKIVWILILFNLTLPLTAISSQSSEVTLLTYNLANYNDHPFWPERLELIVDEIENARADVLVLQEVRLDPDHATTHADYENMAEQILRKLNERGDFINAQIVSQPIMYYPRLPKATAHYPLPSQFKNNEKPYFWEGLSIISKLDIIETGSMFLTSSIDCKDTNKRATQYAKLKINNKYLYVANIHFSSPPCIATHVDETMGYLKKFTNEPMLIMGDFNAKPSDPSLTKISQSGFVDVWQLLHPTEEGNTSSSDNLVKRIDYIWANSLLAAKLTEPNQIWLLGKNKKNGTYPSDHLGIAVKLKI